MRILAPHGSPQHPVCCLRLHLQEVQSGVQYWRVLGATIFLWLWIEGAAMHSDRARSNLSADTNGSA